MNAPVGAGVLVGSDAITVTEYSPDVTIEPMPAATNGIAVGADPEDGSGFRAVLTGLGQLVSGKDWTDSLFLVVRDATPTSKLVVTTTANGADSAVTFGAGVLVNGPLAAFTGAKVNIGSQFRATRAVKTVVMRDLLNVDPANTRIEFGGTLADKTAITARNLFGNVITGSTLTTLKVAQHLGAQVFDPSLPDSVLTAPAIGSVTAKSATIMVNTSGRLNSMVVTGDMSGGVTAGSIGNLSVGSFLGDVDATGTITSLRTTRRFDGEIDAGTITRLNFGGGSVTVNATGAISAIVGRGEGLSLDVIANSVRSVTIAGGLGGNGLAWNVTNGVGTSDRRPNRRLESPGRVSGRVERQGERRDGALGRYCLLELQSERQRRDCRGEGDQVDHRQGTRGHDAVRRPGGKRRPGDGRPVPPQPVVPELHAGRGLAVRPGRDIWARDIPADELQDHGRANARPDELVSLGIQGK